MDILGTIREWYRIREERRDHCKSCLILQEQLTGALAREAKLIAVITTKPEEKKVEIPETPQPIVPKVVPWHIQRQMLEAEDRVKAAAMRSVAENAAKAAKSSDSLEEREISIDALEKELKIGD